LAVEQSSQNPVYYVQYAHARICSIVKNLAAQGIEYKTLSADKLDCLVAPEERELIRQLASLEGEVVSAAKAYDPSRITRYVIDLATLLHKYYNSCRVNCGEDDLTNARLFLCVRVRQVIKNVLNMLNITAPEVM
jgi:arginyl-tRNA synthetase